MDSPGSGLGSEKNNRYLVVTPTLDGAGWYSGNALSDFDDRHHFQMPPVGLVHQAGSVLDTASEGDGAVILMDQGIASGAQLNFIGKLLGRGKHVLLHWPAEGAIEAVNREKLRSMRRHRYALIAANMARRWINRRKQKLVVQSASAPLQPLADSGAVCAAIAHMGREAESLETHLKGGVAEIRRGTSATADHLSVHYKHLASQLEAARVAMLDLKGHPARSAVEASIGSVGELTSSLASLRNFGSGIATYIEGGLPLLERVRQQSEAASADVARIAAPVVQAAAVPQDVSRPYDESDLPAIRAFLRAIVEDARPVPFKTHSIPSLRSPVAGAGLYLRLDFWAPLISGGSYGHTCYQAQALAETSQDFVAVTANRFDLLDDLGVRQVTVPGVNMVQTEANILGMNRYYTERLGVLFDAMRPSYIFERLVLGSAVGAWASRRFSIPYIVEYNGSEISMKRSFAGEGYAHEELLLLAEEAAFRQATLVSAISDHVAADVARRGIPESKIFVNPNAVDLKAYAPAPADERRAQRAGLGFSPDHCVVGFIGTFGGWHGIDVLAASLNVIMRGDPSIRYLLIGDGNLKSMMNEAIAAHGLQDRVVDVGRVPQAKGAELLRACDILVSPHSRNMVDSPFFGSPTKLFEYMGIGAGIVASDLEQIGHVLSPAVRPRDFGNGPPHITNQRALVCQPGNVEDFAAGVLALARNRDAAAALGRNAREAAEKYYSWRQHAQNLWLVLSGSKPEGYAVDRLFSGVAQRREAS